MTAPPLQAPLLQAEHLTRWYDQHCAVRDVSFTLRKGQVLGFLGPNGAGKSTTMQMLAGVLAPSAGRITVGEYDLLDQPEAAKSLIGYLPEQPPVYPELNVDEYLDFCAALRRVPRKQVRVRRDDAKTRCGLEAHGRRIIGNLSKGFQQRVGIAQAIVHQPAIVILDEPTVGLDPIQIREIRALISELGREHAVILSTHILPEVQSVCTDVQVIHRGALVFADTVAALATRAGGGALLIELRNPPPADALAALAGATGVDALGAGRFRLLGQPDAVAVASAAVHGGWGLAELGRERSTLEQLFVELTSSDERAGDEKGDGDKPVATTEAA